MWSCTMKGKFVSLEHSNNFNRVQDVSIRRSSSVVVQEWIKRNLLKSVCASCCITAEEDLYGSKRPVPN